MKLPPSLGGAGQSWSHASPPRALIINQSRRNSSNRSPRTSANQDEEGDEDGQDGNSLRESGREDDLDLMYDPILNCYYDPKTNKYYELAMS